MRRLSLRSLLLAAVLGTMTVGFVALATYIDRIERDNRLNDIDVELVRAERTGTQMSSETRAPQPTGADSSEVSATIEPPVQLLVALDGSVIGGSRALNPFDSATLASLAAADGTRTVDVPHYRVRITTDPSGVIALTALPLEDFDAAVRRFRMALAAGGAVIMVLVAFVLWAVTEYVTRPVTRMAATANRIAAGQLDTPVGPPSGSRETADLAVDLDLMLTRLRSALDAANHSRDEMERFLADMAHEIRTPLTALKGYSDLYRNGMLETPDAVDRAMARIGGESERLTNLANAMLQLASAGADRSVVERFDIIQVVEEVASDLRAAYPTHPIDVHREAVDGWDIVGTRAQVHQALLNLGSNACHHTPPNEPIEIALHASHRSIEVSVIDHGVGVEVGETEQIFLPFFRSDTARSRSGHHGAGLGLALAKQITDRHGGEISVAPTPGGGATFTVSLPRTGCAGPLAAPCPTE